MDTAQPTLGDLSAVGPEDVGQRCSGGTTVFVSSFDESLVLHSDDKVVWNCFSSCFCFPIRQYIHVFKIQYKLCVVESQPSLLSPWLCPHGRPESLVSSVSLQR